MVAGVTPGRRDGGFPEQASTHTPAGLGRASLKSVLTRGAIARWPFRLRVVNPFPAVGSQTFGKKLCSRNGD